MLSILIPTYNQDICPLVEKLHQQTTKLAIPFEIRVYDDASETRWRLKNRNIENISNVIYMELHQNLGRSAIRNKLAREARFPNLLFLDDDAKIIQPNFIKTYIQAMSQHDVVVGGRCYSTSKPIRQKRLHWKYGLKKEQSTTRTFHSNNFLIKKALFEKFSFNEQIIGYGHEDTLFGWQLNQAEISIQYIDNQVQPSGLENKDHFLQKQKQAAANLAWLHDQVPDLATPMIYTAQQLENSLLKHFWKFCLARIQKPILFLLRHGINSLMLLDVYKLSVYILKEAEIRKGFQN